MKALAEDFNASGVGELTIKGNVYQPGKKMSDPANLTKYGTLGNLAKARANTIKDALVKAGVPAEKIKTTIGDTKSRTASYSYKKKD